MLFVLIPLIIVFFFGSLAVAVALLPQAYDWRTMSISQLLYPRVNPQYHFSVPATGIAVSGVLLFPFAGYVRRRLGFDAPMVRAGAVFFAAGAICVILASMITSHPLQGRATVPKLHEVLGRASGIGLGVGILLFEFYALGQRRTEDDSVSRRLVIWWSFITWPAVILVILRLIVVEAHLQALRSFTRSLKQSTVWHLGFWEWIGAVAVIAFLIVSAWLLPGDRDSAA